MVILIPLWPKSIHLLPSQYNDIQVQASQRTEWGYFPCRQAHFFSEVPGVLSQSSCQFFQSNFYFPPNLVVHHGEDLPCKRLINIIVRKEGVHFGRSSVPLKSIGKLDRNQRREAMRIKENSSRSYL